ncbi:unnamed protein product [Nesidiocoris tenuis]|uniref:Cardioactive peptide n=1 Tax=Nesidiocoris tenuis TaxID=355587 RepID=A0A6H5HP83_9HEMI|nr:unnamed protein product [Nesidiocoris tenuis]
MSLRVHAVNVRLRLEFISRIVCIRVFCKRFHFYIKYFYPGEPAEPMEPKMKKPFCNAFTGCGKKRSDESMAALVDLNSEPAVEELSRQILSEAKLWEALQEARNELINRKHQVGRVPNKYFFESSNNAAK